MSLWLLCTVGALLSVERVTYVVVCRNPEGFRRWAAQGTMAVLGGPVNVLTALFLAFKLLQLAVFVGWHLAFGDGTLRPQSADARVLTSGALLIGLGQALNISVFHRLGRTGVFYGNRFGFRVSWCRRFPFTWFEHPQYVGTVAAIWGFFVLMRFPAPDWILVPVLETIYYTAGAWLERNPD